jgi:hypothetical protein
MAEIVSIAVPSPSIFWLNLSNLFNSGLCQLMDMSVPISIKTAFTEVKIAWVTVIYVLLLRGQVEKASRFSFASSEIHS